MESGREGRGKSQKARLAQCRSLDLRGDRGIKASKKDNNNKLLSITMLSRKISRI